MWWETNTSSIEPTSIHRLYSFAFKGNGKHIFKNGIQKKTMFNRMTKINSTMSAQMVMIGSENVQIEPMEGVLSHERLPSSTFFASDTQPICCCSLSEMRKVTFLLNLRRPATLVSIGSEIRIGRAGAS